MSGPVSMCYMIKGAMTQLSESLHNYPDYLVNAAKRMQENRAKLFPMRSPDDWQSTQIIYPTHKMEAGWTTEEYKPVWMNIPQNLQDRDATT